MNKYLTLQEIKPGMIVCTAGTVGIVGAICQSIDGHTYIQLLSPKLAIAPGPHFGEWLPFFPGMWEVATIDDYNQAVKMYLAIAERRANMAESKVVRMAEWLGEDG